MPSKRKRVKVEESDSESEVKQSGDDSDDPGSPVRANSPRQSGDQFHLRTVVATGLELLKASGLPALQRVEGGRYGKLVASGIKGYNRMNLTSRNKCFKSGDGDSALYHLDWDRTQSATRAELKATAEDILKNFADYEEVKSSWAACKTHLEPFTLQKVMEVAYIVLFGRQHPTSKIMKEMDAAVQPLTLAAGKGKLKGEIKATRKDATNLCDAVKKMETKFEALTERFDALGSRIDTLAGCVGDLFRGFNDLAVSIGTIQTVRTSSVAYSPSDPPYPPRDRDPSGDVDMNRGSASGVSGEEQAGADEQVVQPLVLKPEVTPLNASQLAGKAVIPKAWLEKSGLRMVQSLEDLKVGNQYVAFLPKSNKYYCVSLIKAGAASSTTVEVEFKKASVQATQTVVMDISSMKLYC